MVRPYVPWFRWLAGQQLEGLEVARQVKGWQRSYMNSDMIDFDSWPQLVRIAFLAGPFLVGLPGVAMSLYIASTREFHIMLSAIQSSPWFEQQKRGWGIGGLKSRWMLVCFVCGLLLLPGPHIRRGELDINELRNFPRGLKRRMLGSVWLTIIGFTWMLVAFVLIRLSQP